MAELSQPTASVDAPSREDEQPEPLKFDLKIVSASPVSPPLSFSRIPATTSVKDLKSRIRDVLPTKPSDEHQRLIHRGRMLSRESETMLEIFGRETLVDFNSEPQTLHLALRPSDQQSLQQTTGIIVPQRVTTPVPRLPPNNIPQGAPGIALPGIQHLQQQRPPVPTDIPNMITQRMQHIQRDAINMQQEMLDVEQAIRRDTAQMRQDLLNLQSRYRALTGAEPALQNPAYTGAILGQPPAVQNYLQANAGQIQTPLFRHPMPASVQALIAQQQRERAADGRLGAQDGGGLPIGSGHSLPASGRNSPSIHRPEHSHTHTREGIGPNGERWQITVNETTTTFPVAHPVPTFHAHQPHLPFGNPDSLQAFLRNADRAAAAAQSSPNTGEGTTSSETNTSTFQAASNGLSDGSVPAARDSTSTSVPSDQIPIPSMPVPNSATAPASTTPTPDGIEPVVYLLSSPHGPRALLLSNAETYYTPRHSSRRRRVESPAPQIVGQPPQPFVGLPEFRNRNPRARRNGQVPRQENVPLEPVAANAHANPGAGALAAQIGPMIWLIVRLAGFVWFFTAGNSSWTRFIAVSLLAVGVFVVNTGIFNGVAEQIWGPVRRHIENLIPLAGPEAARIPAVNAVAPRRPADAAQPGEQPAPQGRRRRGELDQAQVAAHLLERHRQAHANWAMTQVRRAEHAALLFFASLVPGVGERHIAAREAEANAAEAERQRREDAANAPEPAAEENAQAAANAAGTENQERSPAAEDREAAPEQPLINV